MQRDIPRLHAVLASKNKRIGELEHLLRETKEQANKECDRLREENSKLQRSFMERLKEKEKDSKGERRRKEEGGRKRGRKEEGSEGGREGGRGRRREGGSEGGNERTRNEGREREELTSCMLYKQKQLAWAEWRRMYFFTTGCKYKRNASC